MKLARLLFLDTESTRIWTRCCKKTIAHFNCLYLILILVFNAREIMKLNLNN